MATWSMQWRTTDIINRLFSSSLSHYDYWRTGWKSDFHEDKKSHLSMLYLEGEVGVSVFKSLPSLSIRVWWMYLPELWKGLTSIRIWQFAWLPRWWRSPRGAYHWTSNSIAPIFLRASSSTMQQCDSRIGGKEPQKFGNENIFIFCKTWCHTEEYLE